MNDLETRLHRDLHRLPLPVGQSPSTTLRRVRTAYRRRQTVVVGGAGGLAVASAAILIATPLGLGGSATSTTLVGASPTPTSAATPAVVDAQMLREVALPQWWSSSGFVQRSRQTGRLALTFNSPPRAYELAGAEFVVVDQTRHWPSEGRATVVYHDKTSQTQDDYDPSTAGVQGGSNGKGPVLLRNVPADQLDVFVFTALPQGAARLRYLTPGSSPILAQTLGAVGAVAAPRPKDASAPQATIEVLDADGRLLQTVTQADTRLLRFGTP